MSIILWLDPGTTDTGYAFIRKEGSTTTILDFGTIRTTPKIPLPDKLREISIDLGELIRKYQPDVAGIEKIFFTKNLTTGIEVSHARWVLLLGLRNAAIPIIEYSPPQIKKAICGNGRAPKKQVQNALRLIFKLDEWVIQDDAADALAVAYISALSV